MTMMLGVPIALLGTGRARSDARVEQGTHHEVVPVARPRQNPRHGVADIGTSLTERNAVAQRTDVLFDEI
jgi:hypothetical protein